MIHPYNLLKFLKLIINNWNETVCTVQKHVKWCQLQQKHISKISQITKNGRRKDDFNCTDLNWQLLKTLKWKWRQREFPTSSFNFIFSYFAKYISKSFCLNLLREWNCSNLWCRKPQSSVDTTPIRNKNRFSTACICKVWPVSKT